MKRILIIVAAVLMLAGCAQFDQLTHPDVTSTVKHDIVHRMQIPGVTAVSCHKASQWAPGYTFKCYAYDKNDALIGVYTGLIGPNDGTQVEWYGTFHYVSG